MKDRCLRYKIDVLTLSGRSPESRIYYHRTHENGNLQMWRFYGFTFSDKYSDKSVGFPPAAFYPADYDHRTHCPVEHHRPRNTVGAHAEDDAEQS